MRRALICCALILAAAAGSLTLPTRAEAAAACPVVGCELVISNFDGDAGTKVYVESYGGTAQIVWTYRNAIVDRYKVQSNARQSVFVIQRIIRGRQTLGNPAQTGIFHPTAYPHEYDRVNSQGMGYVGLAAYRETNGAEVPEHVMIQVTGQDGAVYGQDFRRFGNAANVQGPLNTFLTQARAAQQQRAIYLSQIGRILATVPALATALAALIYTGLNPVTMVGVAGAFATIGITGALNLRDAWINWQAANNNLLDTYRVLMDAADLPNPAIRPVPLVRNNFRTMVRHTYWTYAENSMP